jgi:hypothetical protein
MHAALPLACLLAVTLPAAAAERPGPDWRLETPAAAWRPRDSAGEAVHAGRMWILGGWYTSQEAPPRDVWSSADGRDWRLETAEAPWIHSDLPMTAAFAGRLWIMGGWHNGRLPGHSASNAVWSSADGRSWRLETASAAWSPRLAAGCVEFKGRLWILGGTGNYYFGTDDDLRNDVWSSADGRDWRLETAHAGWSPRAYHQAVVHEGRIHVLGGGNYTPTYHARNDVWSSADGVTWRRETAAAPWAPRLWFAAATYRDRMWVLGGWSNHPSTDWGDVWTSADGREWERLTAGTMWKGRHEHSTFVFHDRLWVAGGHARPLSSEVWSLSLPENFFSPR